MKKISVIITAILLSVMFLFTGCLVRVEGSGKIETREFDMDGFTRVEIGSAFDYEIIRSDSFAVSITADDNMFEHIKVTEDGNTLKINMVANVGLFSLFSIGHSTRMVTVRMPELEGLDISGASEGTVSGFESEKDLDIELSGASKLTFTDMNAGKADIDISGASKLSLGGKAGELKISSSGSSDAILDSMETAGADFSLSGASKINGGLDVTGNLKLTLSGSSDVDLSGSAGDVKIDASGASKAGIQDMSVKNADVTLTGSSTARINTNGRLDMDLSGASSIYYTGKPTLGNIDLSGSSNIHNENQ